MKKEEILDYLTDEANIHHAPADSVSAVYFPKNEEDIIQIMKDASSSKTRISTSGAGTGITGSRVPLHGGIVISMERMIQFRPREGYDLIEFQAMAGNASLLLSNDRKTAIVPPGLTLIDLDNGLPYDLFHPPDPTERTSQIGGNVATNASGARGFYYGSTRNRITGLRMILASGEVIRIRRGEYLADNEGMIQFKTEAGKTLSIKIPDYEMPNVKNAAGLYSQPGMDLVDLLIGSEGLFGIFAEIEIVMEELPGQIFSDVAFFDDEKKATSLANNLRLLKARGVLSIEFFNSTALDFIREEFPAIKEGVKAAIFMELSTLDPEMTSVLSSLLKKHGSVEDWFAGNRIDNMAMKEFRHALPDKLNTYLRQHDSYKMGTDFAVPPEAFPDIMAYYHEIGERFKSQHPRDGVHYTMMGHIGDHHVHFNFITHTKEEQASAKSLYLKLAQKAIELGGTISAEHGVGKKTVLIEGREIPYLELMYGKAGLQQIAEIKKIFDPDLLLNLGNMVPIEYY